MKSIAERKPGRTKLVYDKTKRTIVAVAEGTQTPRALNITADDADMFAVITLSSLWMREHWAQIKQDGCVPLNLSSWDDGDALTHAALGVQPSPSVEMAAVLLAGDVQQPDGTPTVVILSPSNDAKTEGATFAAPDGSHHRADGWRKVGETRESIEVSFADIRPELATRRSGILETTVLEE